MLRTRRPQRPARLLTSLVGTVAVGLLLATVPGPAQAASPQGSTATQTVTLVLTPQDRSALRTLGQGRSPGGERARGLAAAMPSPARRNAVARSAAALGLQVVKATPLTVVVRGRGDVIRRTFGSAHAQRSLRGLGRPLPGLPSVLAGAVTVALGGDETRPAFHRLTSQVGPDLRSAYGVASATPTTPISPGASTQTVATVQLTGWNSNDLQVYAANNREAGAPAPSYTEVASTFYPPTDAFPEDALEVALDQEAIYAAAPYVAQRAYTSENSASGVFDSFSQLALDAVDPRVDRHITAVSYSWGDCEADLAGASQLVQAYEDLFAYVVGTGITMFAASGDKGSNCISYPASSPSVVGVGGTSFTTAYDPSSQVAWNDGILRMSGGGPSQLFARPAFQAAAAPAATSRMVPDISALAGNPGFDAVTTAPIPGDSTNSLKFVNVGGTSLASPLTAALFADALREHGYSYGLGSIASGLYAAAQSSFFDVVTGANNTQSAGVGYDAVTGRGTPVWDTLVTQLKGQPHLRGGVGNNPTAVPVAVSVPTFTGSGFIRYRATGTTFGSPACNLLGGSTAPPTTVDVTYDGNPAHSVDGLLDIALLAYDTAGACTTSLSQVFLDTQPPVVTASLVTSRTTRAYKAVFSADDGAGTGLAGMDILVKDLTTGQGIWAKTGYHPSTVGPFPGTEGHTYQVAVRAHDAVGNVSGLVVSKDAVPIDDRAFTGFTRVAGGANDYLATLSSSLIAGAASRATATGKSYRLIVRTGPTYGIVNVFVNNVRVKQFDLYSPTPQQNVRVLFYTSSVSANRAIAVTVTGGKNPASRGIGVIYDGLVASL